MDLNDSETTANSSSEDRSVFYCPKAPDLTWDLNETTFPWVLVAVKSFASPAIIFLNVLVVLIVKRDKQFQKNSYILLSSLAVADLLVGVVTIPFSGSIDLLLALQVSLERVCVLDLINVYSMYCISWCALYHLTAIAWERYVAIRKSIEYLTIVTRSRIIKLMVTVWLTAMFTTIPPLIMEVAGVDISFVDIWVTAASLCGALSVIALAYFYVQVYLGVRKSRLKKISQVTVLVQAKQEKKVAKTTGLLTLVLLFSFVPGIVVSSSVALRTSTSIRVSEFLMQVSSLINPLLYCYRDRRFRRAALELLRMKKPPAVYPATTGAVRAVQRKDPPLGSHGKASVPVGQRNPETSRPLERPASCDPPDLWFDYAYRRSEMALKRSASVPSLAQFSRLLGSSQTQQHPCILVTTATVHAERSPQRPKASDAELPKNARNLQGTEQAIRTRSRSNSCIDASTFVKGGRLNRQKVQEEFRLQTRDDATVVSGRNRRKSSTTSGFTTKLGGMHK